MNTAPTDLYGVAIAAHDAGLCVVPPEEDGSKRPLGPSWKQYQSERPTREQLHIWYVDVGRTGIGYICGAVSGGLELFEFEDQETTEAFAALARDTGLGDLVRRIRDGYLERTPGGGWHLLYRCAEIAGNTKLARRPKLPHEQRDPKDTIAVKIETRGEGGYVVAAPSNGRVHPSGGAYRLVRGGVATITTITPEERADLFALARTFDELPAPPPREPRTLRAESDGVRPGDDFAARTDWADILEPHDWTLIYERGDGTQGWRRPGKDRGISATANFKGTGPLYVFTSSTSFEANESYGKFGAFAVLNHAGDYTAAAAALRAQGFGSPPSQGTHNSGKGAFGSNGSAPNEQKADIWPPRQPLPAESPPVPTLPPAMVPAPLRPWLVSIAERVCLPLEMTAIAAIVAAGAVVGRSVGIRPGQYDDYLVVPNFWGASVNRPGTMKTSAIDEALKPLGRLVTKAHGTYLEAAEQAAVTVEAIDAEIAAIRKRMTKAATDGAPLDDLKAQLADKRKERQEATVTERRYVTHDATVEKLGELLRENPRGMLLNRDELSGWLRTLDKPGREGDREFYLEAWNGTGKFTTDRIGRGTIHIPALTLSILGGIQPGKLRLLTTDALDGGAGDDGLLQRLQLIVWPDRLPPWRKPEAWPDASAREAADGVFEQLDTLVPAAIGATATGDEIPSVRFSPEAQAIFDQWRDELEGRLRSDELTDAPAFASHLAKYRSLMPALALIFELIDVLSSDRSMYGQVGEAATRLAAAWCEFLECHARKLYAVELAGGVGTAHILAVRIEAGAITNGDTVRDIYRAGWSGLKTPDRVLLGLQVLESLGWVRLATEVSGGRPTQVVRLHPELQTEETGDARE